VESPIKVLQVIDSLGMGGAETWLMELLRYWDSQEDGSPLVDFIVTSGTPAYFDEEVRQLGANIFYIPFRRRELVQFTWRFRRLLATNAYTALHDHAGFASGLHFLAAVGHLPPIRLAHIHNPFYQVRYNYGVTPLRRATHVGGKYLVASLASTILATSSRALEQYGCFAPPLQKVPNAVVHCGFAIDRFAGDPKQAADAVRVELGWATTDPVVLFAGRLDESLDITHPRNHKNSALAVEIFRACHDVLPKVKMIMAGANGHIAHAFERHLRNRGLSGAVRTLGVRSDIERLMLASNVLLFPSRAEGLGMVAVEAQAAGLPVVASTTVPKECVVIAELVDFVNLTIPSAHWASQIIAILQRPRPLPTTTDERWVSSAFNIRVSARRLEQLYSGKGDNQHGKTCEGQFCYKHSA
jgi:glycosyltransferase involved in cell wall biosynthesis